MFVYATINSYKIITFNTYHLELRMFKNKKSLNSVYKQLEKLINSFNYKVATVRLELTSLFKNKF